METLIRCVGLKKSYKMRGETVYALKGVDLEIFRGEYVSIMGPSGSGKSTLFNMIGGLDTPSEGRVEIDNINIPELSSRKRAFVRCAWIGYVFQSFNLMPALTALQNVSMPIMFSGVPKDQAEIKAQKLLASVGLGERSSHKPGELSGGQQQRVAIARALVTNPAMLLADEPTGNLDSRTSEEIMGIFQSLNDSGKTVVLITHEPDIAQHAKRVVTVRDGVIQNDEKIQQHRVDVRGITPPVPAIAAEATS